MSKGKRRERQARKLYESAGWNVETPTETKYDDSTDYWGLFDGMATSGDKIIFYQVKSNRAAGIKGWLEDVRTTLPLQSPSVRAHFLVAHDHDGWRLAKIDGGYTWVVDERDESVNMGEGVVQYLSL